SNLLESLLNRDTLIDSSPKFDYLLEEFSGKLAHIDLIPPRIEEADFDLEEEIRLVENLLYDSSSPRPSEELNKEIADTILESLSPSPILVEDSDSHMEEIDLFLATDDLIPPGIENNDHDSEGDIYFLEELLSNDPLPENEYLTLIIMMISHFLQCGVNLINVICLNYTYGDGKPVTCCGCEGPLNGRFCSFYASRAGNSFAYDPNPNSFDDSQNLSEYPPQPSTRRILDLEVSLIMGNKELNTIPEKESDEFIKSSVEDLVPIPTVTFSNPLFNSNDDFTSSDDESLSDENVPEENVRIYLNLLFEFDDEYISSDVNPLFDEVLEDIECKDSYDSNLDESTSLVTPLSDSNEDEYFTPGYDVELLLHRDPSTPIMSVVSILEGFTDEPPLEENDDLFDLKSKENKWKKILYDAPINDLMIEDKVFDLEILTKFFSLTYVSLPFKDHQYLFFTYVIRILLLYFTYPVVSLFLLSSGGEDTSFDPGMSAFHFSRRSGTFISFNVYPNKLNESPMEICSSTRYNPNIMMIWSESS
nr:hypothetical protein [Tanacetum cinerariifolium]